MFTNQTSAKYCGICYSPDLTSKCGTRPFFGGTGRKAVAHTRPGVSQKSLRPHRHSPYYGRLRRRAINPTLPKEVKTWGEGPWGRRKSSNCQDAPGRICAAVNTADRSATRQLNQQNTALFHFKLSLFYIHQISPLHEGLSRSPP